MSDGIIINNYSEVNTDTVRKLLKGDLDDDLEILSCFTTIVWIYEENGIKYVIKQATNKEIKIHEKLSLNSMNVPKLYGYCGKRVVIEYIEGDLLYDVLESISECIVFNYIDYWISTCYELGIEPNDVHSQNIFIDNLGNFIFIDFGEYEWLEDVEVKVSKEKIRDWILDVIFQRHIDI